MAFHNKGKMSPSLTEETGNWAYGNDMLLNNPLTMKTSMALASGQGKLSLLYMNADYKAKHIVRLQRRALQHLEAQLAKLIQVLAVKLEDSVQNDLLQIMNNHTNSVISKYGEDSLQAIFVINK